MFLSLFVFDPLCLGLRWAIVYVLEGSMKQYTENYHAACSWLVSRGPFGGDAEERTRARRLIARALMDMRRIHGRKRARREWYHLHQIGGMFPVKGWLPAD